ncbi:MULTISPECIES: small secreted protein [Kitasatospora]|uniref:Small secreted protein n=2 Tax=Kitasatospora TaxID=2063 RepID=A0ABT1J5Z8_9ACTN|nr:small secreted protein [Kitasatospora paracochleata]MCP2312861.1 hypothetical protein [Kitasatospora paracochleata]
MTNRLLTVSALGALLAFGAVACSGDDSAKLDGWAKSVCDAAQDPIAQSRAALGDSAKIQQGEAPADLQKRLSADLAALAKTNQQLADAVDKAGAPKIDNGAKVQQDAVGELRQASQGYTDAQKKLDGLTNTDQAKFADGLRSVGDSVQQLSQMSTQALNSLQSGTLGDAIKKQPGCKAGPSAPSGAGASGSPATGASGAPATGASGTPATPSGAAPSGSATPVLSVGAAPSGSPSN